MRARDYVKPVREQL